MAEPDDNPDPAIVPRPRLDDVGVTLRRVYDEATNEPLPQTFEDLLKQLG